MGVGHHIAGLLFLHGLFHAHCVNHQFEVLQNLGLVPVDVAIDGFIGQQLGEIALGQNQVQKV